MPTGAYKWTVQQTGHSILAIFDRSVQGPRCNFLPVDLQRIKILLRTPSCISPVYFHWCLDLVLLDAYCNRLGWRISYTFRFQVLFFLIFALIAQHVLCTASFINNAFLKTLLMLSRLDIVIMCAWLLTSNYTFVVRRNWNNCQCRPSWYNPTLFLIRQASSLPLLRWLILDLCIDAVRRFPSSSPVSSYA